MVFPGGSQNNSAELLDLKDELATLRRDLTKLTHITYALMNHLNVSFVYQTMKAPLNGMSCKVFPIVEVSNGEQKESDS